MQDVASSIDRYQVVRRIGAGGMGVVYEADDLDRGQKVALKTISNLDVEKIYQLKREFRALADLSTSWSRPIRVSSRWSCSTAPTC
jgi:serine/threonine protein kinase